VSQQPLLQIDDLHVHFNTSDGVVQAINGASLTLNPGEIVGLVGESGSGKSVTAMSILGLRSEEHTSELQSHHDLVCRLLHEKKTLGWVN